MNGRLMGGRRKGGNGKMKDIERSGQRNGKKIKFLIGETRT